MRISKESWGSEAIRCPFWQGELRETRRIRCEGISWTDRRQTLELCFGGRQSMRAHTEMMCAGRFEDCPVYKLILHTKYTEG